MIAVILSGCSSRDVSPEDTSPEGKGVDRMADRDVRAAYAGVEVGDSYQAVRNALGEPVLVEEGEQVMWFLSPPEPGPVDSPWGPGSIRVEFEDGLVRGKQLNPQVK